MKNDVHCKQILPIEQRSALQRQTVTEADSFIFVYCDSIVKSVYSSLLVLIGFHWNKSFSSWTTNTQTHFLRYCANEYVSTLVVPTTAIRDPPTPLHIFHFRTVFGKNLVKQECIPIGWVPPASMVTSTGGDGPAQGGVCPVGCLPRGASIRRDVFAQGVSAQGCTAPVYRVTDRQV